VLAFGKRAKPGEKLPEEVLETAAPLNGCERNKSKRREKGKEINKVCEIITRTKNRLHCVSVSAGLYFWGAPKPQFNSSKAVDNTTLLKGTLETYILVQ
jgi:hypothetical protein